MTVVWIVFRIARRTKGSYWIGLDSWSSWSRERKPHGTTLVIDIKGRWVSDRFSILVTSTITFPLTYLAQSEVDKGYRGSVVSTYLNRVACDLRSKAHHPSLYISPTHILLRSAPPRFNRRLSACRPLLVICSPIHSPASLAECTATNPSSSSLLSRLLPIHTRVSHPLYLNSKSIPTRTSFWLLSHQSRHASNCPRCPHHGQSAFGGDPPHSTHPHL